MDFKNIYFLHNKFRDLTEKLFKGWDCPLIYSLLWNLSFWRKFHVYSWIKIRMTFHNFHGKWWNHGIILSHLVLTTFSVNTRLPIIMKES
jgi:hypothetical protein